MKTKIGLSIVALSMLAAGPVNAQSPECFFFSLTGPVACGLITTVTGLTTWGGVELTRASVRSGVDEALDKEKAAKAVERYLRQNSLQLAEDLASGRGPVLDEIAATLHVSPENEREYRRRITKDRSELLALADKSKLDPSRAMAFLERIVTLMQQHAGLRRDIARIPTHA